MPGQAFGGVGVQLPTTFRDPAQILGVPGPNGQSYWIGGGGSGTVGPFPSAGPSGENKPAVCGGGQGRFTAVGGSGVTGTGAGGGGGQSNPTVSTPTNILGGGGGGSGIVLIAYPT